MDLTPYLQENARVLSITRRFPSFLPNYDVELVGGGSARVIHAPNKLAAFLRGLGEYPVPCVIIAANRRTPQGLVRQRVDEGLRFAQHHERNGR